MEHSPFIHDVPTKSAMYRGFPIAMFEGTGGYSVHILIPSPNNPIPGVQGNNRGTGLKTYSYFVPKILSNFSTTSTDLEVLSSLNHDLFEWKRLGKLPAPPTESGVRIHPRTWLRAAPRLLATSRSACFKQ